jgi:hypothetical protein
MASTDEQKTSVPVPKPPTYRSAARHMISTSIGYDTSVVCVLAAYEQVADPADPAQACFDVVQLQYLNGLTHPQVVNNVALTLKRPPLPGSEFDLVVDETVIFGAGDAFKGLGKSPKRTIITAGNTATQDGFRWTLGQQVMLSKLTSALHQGELKIAKELTGAPALEAAIREANAGATGVVDHNPLLFATAIGLWHADKWWRGSLGRREPRVLHGYAKQKGFKQ